MIYYTSSEANFWRVFLIWYGSVIPRALPQACLSAGLACLYEMLGVAGSRGDLIEHPYVVHILGLVLGYLLVQRSQLAYQRWWEARTSIAQMTGKWTDAITQLVEFEHISPLPDARHFRARMVHLGSLLHAVAFADLREDWKYTDTSAATLADDDPFGLALIRVKREGGGGPGGVRAGLQDGGPATDRDLSHNGSRCAASPGPKDAEAPAPLPFTHLRHTARAKYDTRRDSRRGGERSLGAQRKRSGLSPWRFTATAVLHLYDPVAYGQQALANPFGIIGGLGRGERRALAGSHSRDRVQQVQTWLLSLVVKRHADGGLPVPAPILSRSYQVLSDGHLGYMQARKVGDTPFPFPYVQLATLLLHAFNLLAPLVIAANITTALDAHALAGVGDAGDGNVGASGAPGAGRGGGLALMAALSFFATLGYTALNQVARELEEPFGHGPNHLPLAQFQDECNAKLVQLLCRDAGAPVPDDPFLGDEAEGLSEEAKAVSSRWHSQSIDGAQDPNANLPAPCAQRIRGAIHATHSPHAPRCWAVAQRDLPALPSPPHFLPSRCCAAAPHATPHQPPSLPGPGAFEFGVLVGCDVASGAAGSIRPPRRHRDNPRAPCRPWRSRRRRRQRRRHGSRRHTRSAGSHLPRTRGQSDVTGAALPRHGRRG